MRRAALLIAAVCLLVGGGYAVAWGIAGDLSGDSKPASLPTLNSADAYGFCQQEMNSRLAISNGWLFAGGVRLGPNAWECQWIPFFPNGVKACMTIRQEASRDLPPPSEYAAVLGELKDGRYVVLRHEELRICGPDERYV